MAVFHKSVTVKGKVPKEVLDALKSPTSVFHGPLYIESAEETNELPSIGTIDQDPVTGNYLVCDHENKTVTAFSSYGGLAIDGWAYKAASGVVNHFVDETGTAPKIKWTNVMTTVVWTLAALITILEFVRHL